MLVIGFHLQDDDCLSTLDHTRLYLPRWLARGQPLFHGTMSQEHFKVVMLLLWRHFRGYAS